MNSPVYCNVILSDIYLGPKTAIGLPILSKQTRSQSSNHLSLFCLTPVAPCKVLKRSLWGSIPPPGGPYSMEGPLPKALRSSITSLQQSAQQDFLASISMKIGCVLNKCTQNHLTCIKCQVYLDSLTSFGGLEVLFQRLLHLHAFLVVQKQ